MRMHALYGMHIRIHTRHIYACTHATSTHTQTPHTHTHATSTDMHTQTHTCYAYTYAYTDTTDTVTVTVAHEVGDHNRDRPAFTRRAVHQDCASAWVSA